MVAPPLLLTVIMLPLSVCSPTELMGRCKLEGVGATRKQPNRLGPSLTVVDPSVSNRCPVADLGGFPHNTNRH